MFIVLSRDLCVGYKKALSHLQQHLRNASVERELWVEGRRNRISYLFFLVMQCFLKN